MRIRLGLLRPFDFSTASNRFVLLATPAVGIAAGITSLVTGSDWGEAFRNGFGAGGCTFLAWAISRELHPDRPELATVAALLSPLSLLRGDPDLLASGVVLLVCRVVAGTTGRGLRWADLGLIAAVAIPLAWRAVGPGVLTVSAVALAATLAARERGWRPLLATSIAVAGAAAFAWTRFKSAGSIDLWLAIPVALGLVSLVGPRRVIVDTDRAGGVISPVRVRAARAAALLAAAAAALTSGPEALSATWAALAVVALRPR